MHQRFRALAPLLVVRIDLFLTEAAIGSVPVPLLRQWITPQLEALERIPEAAFYERDLVDRGNVGERLENAVGNQEDNPFSGFIVAACSRSDPMLFLELP